MTEFLTNIDPNIILGVKLAVMFIVADTLFGYFLALKNRTFDIKKVPQFLATGVLPYVGGLLITAFLAILDANFMYLFASAVAGITIKFGWETLKEKLVELIK